MNVSATEGKSIVLVSLQNHMDLQLVRNWDGSTGALNHLMAMLGMRRIQHLTCIAQCVRMDLRDVDRHFFRLVQWLRLLAGSEAVVSVHITIGFRSHHWVQVAHSVLRSNLGVCVCESVFCLLH